MEEMIRRSDAIKALRKRWARTISYDGIGEDIGEECEDVIKAVPSADRPQGEWIDRSDGIEGAWNYCSVCGEQAIDLYDFCPNCGAKMDGERKEKCNE